MRKVLLLATLLVPSALEAAAHDRGGFHDAATRTACEDPVTRGIQASLRGARVDQRSMTARSGALRLVNRGRAAAPTQPPAADVTDTDVEGLLTALDRARGYNDLVTILTRHERVLVSSRILEWIDRQLRNSSLNESQRGIFVLARLTALDSRDRGPREAAQLLSVRLIAASALAADTPQQFAATLTMFSEFAPVITAALVGAALDTPGNTWPEPVLPLMEQLAAEWPRLDALAAATRVADAANRLEGAPQANGTAGGATDPVLVGHWRTTRVVFESPRDDHLVLRAEGTAERWTVTASSTSARTVGRWAVANSVLNLTWTGEDQTSQPFTIYQGQLVLPNIPNRRVFWERVDR